MTGTFTSREGFSIMEISDDEIMMRDNNSSCFNYRLFTEKGFDWGGDFSGRVDYQHFELPNDITDKYNKTYEIATY